MTAEGRDPAPQHSTKPEMQRRWTGPMILGIIVLIPVGILIFSNLSTETISWLGFELTAPLWLILIATFIAGMLGGKVFGWGWRRYRRRRKQLKEELAVLRKHAADTETQQPTSDEDD
jgi:uncharacterized integral membrane protein